MRYLYFIIALIILIQNQLFAQTIPIGCSTECNIDNISSYQRINTNINSSKENIMITITLVNQCGFPKQVQQLKQLKLIL